MKLSTALRAGYVFYYCQTIEMSRYEKIVIDEIKKLKSWEIKLWDFETDSNPDNVKQLLKETSNRTAIIAKNFNWFLENNYEMIQFIQNNFEEFSDHNFRKALIILSDQDFNSAIPNALKRDFIKLDFPLPTKKELSNILNDIIVSLKDNKKFIPPNEQEKDDIINSAIGLTEREAQNAFSYSIISNGSKIDPSIVADMRSAEINETSGLKVGKYKIDDIAGNDIVKDFIKNTINNPNSRGILLLGPPGTGKTTLGKWASSISKKIFIEFELANVQGQGLYGQAEAEMNNALKVITSIGNSVLFIDEIEKAVPSKQSSGHDTTGTRSFSQLLKFLSDNRPDGCYVIATCNDISKLPPEWIRSERFDVIFFIDLPNKDEKKAIYKQYLEKYNVKKNGFDIDSMHDWTGAEIKTACRLASIMNKSVKKANNFVVPIAKTMQEDIEYLRNWAKDKTIAASSPETKTKKHRKIDI